MGTKQISTQFNPVQQKSQHNNNNNNNNNNGTTTTTNNKNISIVIPYIEGLGEKLKKTCSRKGIQVHFKGSNTIQNINYGTQGQGNQTTESGVICRYTCPQINCPKEYIERLAEAFWDRLKEHLRTLSSIHQKTSSTGPPISSSV